MMDDEKTDSQMVKVTGSHDGLQLAYIAEIPHQHICTLFDEMAPSFC
jgi:hypothetical protein